VTRGRGKKSKSIAGGMSASKPSGWWGRIREQLVANLLALVIGGAVVFVFQQVVFVHSPKVNTLETSVVALKCFLYKQERTKFFSKCIADGGEMLPDTSCQVGSEYRTFDDPLPQAMGTCK